MTLDTENYIHRTSKNDFDSFKIWVYQCLDSLGMNMNLMWINFIAKIGKRNHRFCVSSRKETSVFLFFVWVRRKEMSASDSEITHFFSECCVIYLFLLCTHIRIYDEQADIVNMLAITPSNITHVLRIFCYCKIILMLLLVAGIVYASALHPFDFISMETVYALM